MCRFQITAPCKALTKGKEEGKGEIVAVAKGHVAAVKPLRSSTKGARP